MLEDDWKGENKIRVANDERRTTLKEPERVKHRRNQIVRLAEQGLTSKEIAEKVNISASLVRAEASLRGVSLKRVSSK